MGELLKDQVFATHTIAAASSLTLGTLLTYPLDTIKTIIQVGSSSTKMMSTSHVRNLVQSISGNPGFYSGFGWAILGRLSGVGTRFGVYEILGAYCKDGRKNNYVYVSEALVAGAVAGATESLLSSPLELIKMRAQVTSAIHVPSSTSITEERSVAPLISRLLRGYSPDKKVLSHSVGLLSILNAKFPNMSGALKELPWMMSGSGRPPAVYHVRRLPDVISLEGWGALWRGLRSGIVRDSVFGGVFFASWQFQYRKMISWKAVHMDPIPSNHDGVDPLSPLVLSLAAGFSGTIAAAASHSFDTARTRSQCMVMPKYLSMERKLLRWGRPGTRFQRIAGIHPADKSILYRGILPRMARCGLASFVMVWSYYLAVQDLISS